ncbi:MAG: 4Fe-4S binding protein [Candidatus Bathyarchaeia archaeon]
MGLPKFISEALRAVARRPFTLMYPFERREPSEGFRGRQVFDLSKCINCGICAMDCPAFAIEMVDICGKRWPKLYLDRCVFCYQCAASCPKNVISSTRLYELAGTSREKLVIAPEPPAVGGDRA